MFKKISHTLRLPQNILLLALFGFFLGLSSSMVYSQLVLFLKSEFNTSNSDVAFLDGLVELISYITRVFSGVISDFLRNKKSILLIGCFLTFITKPLLFLAGSYWTVFFAQSIDRVSNGIQASPRDALIAETSDPKKRSQSYGFTRSMKTIGAFLGSAFALMLLSRCQYTFREVFLVASCFAFIAFFTLFLIKYDEKKITIEKKDTKSKVLIDLSYIKFLPKKYWKLIILAFIYELGHFADSLLHIRANNFMPLNEASKAHLLITIGQILSAYPMGLLSDKFNKRIFIKVCFVIMIISNIFLLIATSGSEVLIAAFLWGIQLGATQGLFLSAIADVVPKNYIATAIGIFYCFVGSAYFIASVIAGKLWERFGNGYTFMYSIGMVILAFIMMNFLYPAKGEKVGGGEGIEGK